MTFPHFLKYAYYSGIGVNLILSVIFLFRKQNLLQWLFLLVFICYAVVEGVGFGMSSSGIPNGWWYSYMYPIIYGSVAVLYLASTILKKSQKRIIGISIPLYWVCSYLLIWSSTDDLRFNFAGFQIGYLLWLSWALLWLRARFLQPAKKSIFQDPHLWVSLGLLLSSAMIMLIMLGVEYYTFVLRDTGMGKAMVGPMNVLNLMLQVLFLIGQAKSSNQSVL